MSWMSRRKTISCAASTNKSDKVSLSLCRGQLTSPTECRQKQHLLHLPLEQEVSKENRHQVSQGHLLAPRNTLTNSWPWKTLHTDKRQTLDRSLPWEERPRSSKECADALLQPSERRAIQHIRIHCSHIGSVNQPAGSCKGLFDLLLPGEAGYPRHDSLRREWLPLLPWDKSEDLADPIQRDLVGAQHLKHQGALPTESLLHHPEESQPHKENQ